jgi:hypothetical protein
MQPNPFKSSPYAIAMGLPSDTDALFVDTYANYGRTIEVCPGLLRALEAPAQRGASSRFSCSSKQVSLSRGPMCGEARGRGEGRGVVCLHSAP